MARRGIHMCSRRLPPAPLVQLQASFTLRVLYSLEDVVSTDDTYGSTQLIIVYFPDHLAIGLVILVSMAIALGVVFLGVLIALIITLSRRHDDANAYPPVVIPPYDADYTAHEATSPAPFLAGTNEKSKGKMTPTPMLETINAATVALSAGHPSVVVAGGVRVIPGEDDGNERTLSSADERDNGTTSEDNSIYDDPEEGNDSLPSRAVRYSFDAEREEELSINTGDMVEVLDESDEHWHIVRRLRDGRQGELIVFSLPHRSLKC